MSRAWLVALPLCLLLASGCAEPAGPQPQRLPTVPIIVNGRSILVEIARTPEQRAMGMMYRKTLGPDEGMLFVSPHAEYQNFYMKDTFVPLSIAFLDDDGVIINLDRMEPLSLRTHRSRLPCRLVLEMPAGWFAAEGLKEGDTIGLPDDLSAQ